MEWQLPPHTQSRKKQRPTHLDSPRHRKRAVRAQPRAAQLQLAQVPAQEVQGARHGDGQRKGLDQPGEALGAGRAQAPAHRDAGAGGASEQVHAWAGTPAGQRPLPLSRHPGRRSGARPLLFLRLASSHLRRCRLLSPRLHRRHPRLPLWAQQLL